MATDVRVTEACPSAFQLLGDPGFEPDFLHALSVGYESHIAFGQGLDAVAGELFA